MQSMVPSLDGHASYLADEFHQSSDSRVVGVSALPLTILLPFNHRRPSFSGRRFPTVENSAAESHVDAVTDCFAGDP